MLLYPALPFAGHVPDEAYADELALAESSGLNHALLDVEALLDGHAQRALRWVKSPDSVQTAVYRGWILRPEVFMRA